MKTFLTLTALLCFTAAQAQQAAPFTPSVGLKLAPTGLILGNIGLQAEYSFSAKRSLTACISVPVRARHSFEFEDGKAAFNFRSSSFMTGFRNYFSGKKKMQGVYIEPFFKYLHHISEGLTSSSLNYRPVKWDMTNDFNAFGVGAQLGVQFVVRERVFIDLFLLGPEINAASSRFKATQLADAIPWTEGEAREAETEIRNFLQQFPVLSDRTTITADKFNKTVSADFKGALPGLRTGISIGVAF